MIPVFAAERAVGVSGAAGIIGGTVMLASRFTPTTFATVTQSDLTAWGTVISGLIGGIGGVCLMLVTRQRRHSIETERLQKLQDIETQKAERDAILGDVNKKHDEEIRSLKAEYRQDVASLKQEQAAAITGLKQEHATAIASERADIASLRKLLDDMRLTLHNTREQSAIYRTDLAIANLKLEQLQGHAPAVSVRTPVVIEAKAPVPSEAPLVAELKQQGASG